MKKRSFVLCRTATTFLAGSILFIAFTIYFFLEKQALWGWISVACALFFLIAAAFVPLFYVIDKNGIRIRYFTGDKEVYEWKNVGGVVAEYDSVIPYLFDTFRIDGEDYTVYMFYKEGRLERSARTARLVKEYYGKEIDGLLPEGVKGAAARRFKLSHGKAPDSTAAQAAEREVRKAVRAAASELGDGVKALSLEYAYFTADGRCEKRPALDYTYTLELKRGKEKIGSVTLLTVKRGAKEMKVGFTADADAIKTEIGAHI